MERYDATTDMRTVAAEALALVQMAEQAWFRDRLGRRAPPPSSFWWRPIPSISDVLGGSVPRPSGAWNGCGRGALRHPIRVAGEAALADLLSGGRLEFGISARRLPV